MTRVCVDDQVSEFSMGAENSLEDVVQLVTSRLPANRIVKEILLDGRHLPKFQRGQALDNLLGEINELQIRTADREIWATNGLEIALTSIERLQRSLIRVAEVCHDTDKTQADRFLGPCIEGLERFLETIIITRGALNLDFSRIHVDGITLSQIEREFMNCLDSVVDFQTDEDYVALADIVEYELLTNLSSWARALRQLRTSALSNA